MSETGVQIRDLFIEHVRTLFQKALPAYAIDPRNQIQKRSQQGRHDDDAHPADGCTDIIFGHGGMNRRRSTQYHAECQGQMRPVIVQQGAQVYQMLLHGFRCYVACRAGPDVGRGCASRMDSAHRGRQIAAGGRGSAIRHHRCRGRAGRHTKTIGRLRLVQASPNWRVPDPSRGNRVSSANFQKMGQIRV